MDKTQREKVLEHLREVYSLAKEYLVERMLLSKGGCECDLCKQRKEEYVPDPSEVSALVNALLINGVCQTTKLVVDNHDGL